MGQLLSVSPIARGRCEFFPSSLSGTVSFGNRLPVQLDRSDAATRASRVVHQNPVCRGPMAIAQFKSRPARRDAGLRNEVCRPAIETKNRFNGDAVRANSPSRCTTSRPPRPVCGGAPYTSAQTTYGSTL
jgi:hypothetical protein